MDHYDIRSILAERAGAALSASAALPQPLRPYQYETIVSLKNWLEDRSGTRRAHVVHATGLGKTVEFSSWIRFIPDLRVIIVVPTKPLVVQTARTLRAFTGKVVGHLSSIDSVMDRDGNTVATRGYEGKSVVVTTYASFKRRVGELLNHYKPHLIVVDECHWGCTRKFQHALAPFRDAVSVGFTGTDAFAGLGARAGYVPVTLDNGQVAYCHPERMTSAHFGTLLDRRSLHWGVQNGYLAPLAWTRIQTDISVEQVPMREGEYGLEYDAGELSRAMRAGWPRICEAVRRMYNDDRLNLVNRQTFSICPGKVSADHLAEMLWKDGCAAAYSFTGDVEDRESGILLDGFAERDIGHLASVFKLREGWDAPVAEVAFMLRAMQSILFYQQIVGRVGRPFSEGPGKVGLIVDIGFQDSRSAALSAPVVFGRPGETITEGGFLIPPPQSSPVISPFLPPETEQKTVTVFPLEPERYADREGVLKDETGEWATAEALAKRFGITDDLFTRILVRGPIRVRRRVARRASGRKDDFFLLSDAYQSWVEYREID